ncbi:MAG: hypothetical protein RMM29_07905 [Planctomycetota bacterium]|nr:hypothetical protein [Planctomycetota bacterium]
MGFVLICESDGRRFPLLPGKAVVLRVRRGDQLGGEITIGVREGHPYLDNRSGVPCLVNDIERSSAELAVGDRLCCGQLRLSVAVEGQPAEQPAPAPVPPASSSVQEQGGAPRSDRHQRRISASRLSPLSPQAGNTNMFKRVSAVFNGRAERQRLEQLEAERRAALLEAGRRSLADGSALGLPPEAMLALAHGQPVTLTPEQLSGFAQWREDRQRLVRLDAEIAALRQSLGLGPDPEAVILATPPLRSDEQQKLNRAFATMDVTGTQELENLRRATTPRSPPPRPAR